MSVLIKGMKKPKDCYQCRLHYGHGECGVSVDGNCPLTELPDHGDLVDRDELYVNTMDYCDLEEKIWNAPAVIPAERSEE